MREVRDHYFREAKREGYLSRAAYKLIEIDDRKSVLSKGDAVLDCGSAPGSWLQVAAHRVGPEGVVVGVDLQPIEPDFGEDNIFVVQADLRDVDADTLRDLIGRRHFNVVLSDMAPSTTGDPRSDHLHSAQLCGDLLDRLPDLLVPGGNLIMKVFEGETYPDLLQRTRSLFDKAKGFKPKASRSESVEMFIIGHGYRGLAGAERHAAEEAAPAPPRKPPSKWG